MLCNEIKKNFTELRHGNTTENIPKEADLLTFGGKLRDIPADLYPLFMTTKDLLLLLDSSLDGEPFFKRDGTGQMMHNIPGWGKNKAYLSFLPLLDDVGHAEEQDDENEEGNISLEEEKTDRKAAKRKMHWRIIMK